MSPFEIISFKMKTVEENMSLEEIQQKMKAIGEGFKIISMKMKSKHII